MENFEKLSSEYNLTFDKLVNNEIELKTQKFLSKVIGKAMQSFNRKLKASKHKEHIDIDQEFLDIFLNVKDGKLDLKTADSQLKSLMIKVLKE
jgi:predicted P-loop ATPase